MWLAAWSDAITAGGPLRAGETELLPAELVREAVRPRGSDDDGGYALHWEIHGEDPLVFGHAGSDGTLAMAVPAAELLLLYFTQTRGAGTAFEWLAAAQGLW